MIEYLPWSKREFNKGLKNSYKGLFDILDIELGGQCNFKCIYCDSPSRDKKCTISIEKIEEVLKSQKIKWIFICGLGEPTAGGNMSKFIEILELCSKYKIKCSCFTNISVLTPEIENFIKNGVLHLLFKYDSTDLSVVSDLYGIKADSQTKNIEAIKKLVKVERGYTNIAASIVPTKKNKNEILSVVKDCIDNNIFPLIAELENSGAAQECYNELMLTDEELEEIKTQVNQLIDEDYEIPLCPAVINSVHVRYDGTVTVDTKTGLSCHWFWLEEPQTYNIGDFNELAFSDITSRILKYRQRQINEVKEIYKNKSKFVFGGCGGDLEKVLSKYISTINGETEKYIYLDNNATTKLSVGVKKAIKIAMYKFPNPSSAFSIGKKINKDIQAAREHIRTLINMPQDNDCGLIFTGSATESNNSVFNACVQLYPDKKHIIISAVEHPSIYQVAKSYQEDGYEITFVSVDKAGRLNTNELVDAVRDDTLLVSVMMVNSEIGNIYPIQQIVEKVKEKNHETLVHTDAVQAIGKMEVDVQSLGVDFLSISGHKFHAPKGVGCLYIKDTTKFKPFILGGEQEKGLRGGTENTISILAMGQAAEETYKNLRENIDRIEKVRSYLEQKLKQVSALYKLTIIGDIENRICNTLCVLIEGADGYKLMDMLSRLNIYVSVGSACDSKKIEPTRVMKALGVDAVPLRISLSKYTTEQEIDEFYGNLLRILRTLKIQKNEKR